MERVNRADDDTNHWREPRPRSRGRLLSRLRPGLVLASALTLTAALAACDDPSRRAGGPAPAAAATIAREQPTPSSGASPATATAAGTPAAEAIGRTPTEGSASATTPRASTSMASPSALTPTAVAAAAAPTAATSAAGVAASSSGSSGGAEPSVATRVYQRNARSVVNVNSLAVARLPGGAAQQQPRGMGSGFVLDAGGHIVTNNHVVAEADQLTVTIPLDQQKVVVPARLVGRDPINDLAVVKVDLAASTPAGRLGDLIAPVAMGRMDRVVVGEPVVAMGAPLGLTHTITTGIVSALRAPGAEETQQLELVGGVIQTDAAVNPGNSGGPLFNAAGEVIGVTTAGVAPGGGQVGLNFAIPVDVVKRVAPELIQSGCFRHPLIGISAIPLSQIGQAAKTQLGVPQDRDGLLVQEATHGAAAAGIRAGEQVVSLGGEGIRAGGDVIVAIDGRPTSSGGDLRAYIENQKRPSESVTLTVLRQGQSREVAVKLSERPNETCPRG